MSSILQAKHDGRWTLYLLDDSNNILLFRNFPHPIPEDIMRFLELTVEALDEYGGGGDYDYDYDDDDENESEEPSQQEPAS